MEDGISLYKRDQWEGEIKARKWERVFYCSGGLTPVYFKIPLLSPVQAG